jgi:ribosome-binding factor A
VRKESRRQQRVGELIKEEISKTIQSDLRDPRIGFVTVSSVTISPDFASAKVYVQILGNEKQKHDTLIGLQHAAPYIKSDIAAKINLRKTPDFHFYYDDTVDHYDRINTLLKEISDAS